MKSQAEITKPDPRLPPETPCVECGAAKSAHSKAKMWCLPMVLLEENQLGMSTWRQFR